ncbi:Uncharacterised protein [Chlamydia trachomatis]|nr:Uncharacterised protein [Chlamydia trachomatis]
MHKWIEDVHMTVCQHIFCTCIILIDSLFFIRIRRICSAEPRYQHRKRKHRNATHCKRAFYHILNDLSHNYYFALYTSSSLFRNVYSSFTHNYSKTSLQRLSIIIMILINSQVDTPIKQKRWQLKATSVDYLIIDYLIIIYIFS